MPAAAASFPLRAHGANPEKLYAAAGIPMPDRVIDFSTNTNALPWRGDFSKIDLHRCLAFYPDDEATELRTLEALKLDQAEVHLQAGVKAGDPRAITTLVRISESRRRLLGLDMPEQHEVRISREEETLIDQLAAALAERDRREDREGL